LRLGQGWWYLIIENDTDNPIAIHYELEAD